MINDFELDLMERIGELCCYNVDKLNECEKYLIMAHDAGSETAIRTLAYNLSQLYYALMDYERSLVSLTEAEKFISEIESLLSSRSRKFKITKKYDYDFIHEIHDKMEKYHLMSIENGSTNSINVLCNHYMTLLRECERYIESLTSTNMLLYTKIDLLRSIKKKSQDHEYSMEEECTEPFAMLQEPSSCVKFIEESIASSYKFLEDLNKHNYGHFTYNEQNVYDFKKIFYDKMMHYHDLALKHKVPFSIFHLGQYYKRKKEYVKMKKCYLLAINYEKDPEQKAEYETELGNINYALSLERENQ